MGNSRKNSHSTLVANYKTGAIVRVTESKSRKRLKKRKQKSQRIYAMPPTILQILGKAGYANPVDDKIRKKQSFQTQILHKLFQASFSTNLSPGERAELLIYTLQFWIDDEELIMHMPPVYDLDSLDDEATDTEGNGILEVGKTYQEYFHKELKDKASIPIDFFNNFLSVILSNIYGCDLEQNQSNRDLFFKTLHTHVDNLYEIYTKLDIRQKEEGKKKKIISRDTLWNSCSGIFSKKLSLKQERLYHAIFNKFMHLKNIPTDPDGIKEKFALLLYLKEHPNNKELLHSEAGRRVLSEISYHILSS